MHKILFAGFFRTNVQTWKARYRKDKMIHGLELHCKFPDAREQRAASSLDTSLQQNIMWCIQHTDRTSVSKYFHFLSCFWCEVFSLTAVCFHCNPSSLSKRTLQDYKIQSFDQTSFWIRSPHSLLHKYVSQSSK